MSFRVEPRLRLAPGSVARSAARALLSFGFWAWLLTATRILANQLGPIVIGARLGVGAVTPFAIAGRLVAYAAQLLMAATGVLTPVATALCATDKTREQQYLVLEGGKLCLSASLFFLIFFLLLGGAFLETWFGTALETSQQLLLVLALGECLPLGLAVGASTILGLGRHRIQACAGVVENLAILALAALLVDRLGLIGMALALAIPAFLCRGVIQLLVVCRAVNVSLARYLRESMAPALTASVLPAALLVLLTWHQAPVGWLELIVYSALYTASYGASLLLLGTGAARRAIVDACRSRIPFAIRSSAGLNVVRGWLRPETPKGRNEGEGEQP